MKSIEFRDKGTDFNAPAVDVHQPTLAINVENKREVYWLQEKRETRRRLLGNKTITSLVVDADSQMPKATFIDAANIAQLNDPQLRYALRFADAADSVGWTEVSPYISSRHNVTVTAFDNGVDTEFVSASYSGIGKAENDSFMRNLHSVNTDGL